MSHVIGNDIIDGVPYINGKQAVWREVPEPDFMDGVLSKWRCPECDARLSATGQICLNACHLSAAANRRFNESLLAARGSDGENRVSSRIRRKTKGTG